MCGAAFVPHVRVGERQRVCHRLPCQQERKRRAQQRWLAKNPDAFKGRYVNLQEWLAQHPGYLASYRERRRQKPRDIQDESSTGFREARAPSRDIQDELNRKITIGQQHLDLLRACMADMQDELNAWPRAA